VRPQGVQLHARAPHLARHGGKLAEELRARFPWLDVWFGIAGDWDDPKVPGYSDGWEESARTAVGSGVTCLVLNCEPAWKSRPKGSAAQAVRETFEAAPTLRLGHTSYGAPAPIDGDPKTPGWQNFGGHGNYPWREFCGPESPVAWTAPQFYWSRKNGEHDPRGRGIAYMTDYAASVAEAKRLRWIRPDMPVHAYLQAYDARTDELCLASERYPVTCWWTWPERMDDAGTRAIAALAELHRRGLSIREYQTAAGLVSDGLVGPKTLAALGIK
jgi:hypothetical protein